MSLTQNYQFYKPSEGESGCAYQLNANLDSIDNLIKACNDSMSQHFNSTGTKHQSRNISYGEASNVENALNNLSSSKANTNHTHSNYATKDEFTVVQNTLNLLLPDLSGVTLSANIQNRFGGIRIIGSVNPSIHITQWSIRIEKNGSIVCETVNSANNIYINHSFLEGVENGDLLQIKVAIHSGTSTKQVSYNHTYYHQNTAFEQRLERLEQELTLGNFIDSFAQDQDALQALANVLHHSNTLAQKVAELQLSSK